MLDLGEREIKRKKENPLKFYRKLGFAKGMIFVFYSSKLGEIQS
jgi:hypothetical protein